MNPVQAELAVRFLGDKAQKVISFITSRDVKD